MTSQPLLVVQSELRAAYPEMVSVLVGPVPIRLQSDSTIAEVIRRLQSRMDQAKGAGVDLLARDSLARWVDVYKRMGASPKYESSAAALSRSYQEHGMLASISPVVDLYNWISLTYAIPMAAYDISRIDGPLQIRLASKGEEFIPLGRPKNPEKTKNGEVVYADSSRVICRYWNYRDCDHTKISDSTSDVVFLLDLIATSSSDSAQLVVADLQQAFQVEIPIQIVSFS
jgi:DNA/RNA-binding domain of Phe-tRNA-synthetase-like protein